MGIIEILLISLSVAMDAFSVSVVKSLSFNSVSLKRSLIISCYFSLFQGIMPLIGMLMGRVISGYVVKYHHLITFILFLFLGIQMIREDSKDVNDSLDVKTMLLLSFATSVDALMVGFTFSLVKVNLIIAILSIVSITFLLCFIGSLVSSFMCKDMCNIAKNFGGSLLILYSFKILVSYFF